MNIPHLQRALRYCSFLFLALTACLAGMALSYYLVRTLAHTGAATPPPARHVEQARLLRAWSNELVLLANDFLAHTGAPPIGTEARAWLNNRFHPRTVALRRRLAAAVDCELPPRTALLHAADRLVSLARHPETPALRRAALRDVHRAATRAEAYVERHGLAPFLRTPRELPAFPAAPAAGEDG